MALYRLNITVVNHLLVDVDLPESSWEMDNDELLKTLDQQVPEWRSQLDPKNPPEVEVDDQRVLEDSWKVQDLRNRLQEMRRELSGSQMTDAIDELAFRLLDAIANENCDDVEECAKELVRARR